MPHLLTESRNANRCCARCSRWLNALLLVLAVVFPASLLQAQENSLQLYLNEIRVDQRPEGQVENPISYIEIRGLNPALNLSEITFLALGNRPAALGGEGCIVTLVNIGELVPTPTLSPEGYLLIAPPNFTGIPSNNIEIRFSEQVSFPREQNLTYMLVTNFDDSTYGLGSDMDLNDDGVLDRNPWDTVLDRVATIGIDPFFGGNSVYASRTFGPAGYSDSVYPAHIFRCSESWAWRVGRKEFTLSGPSSTTRDTPGIINQSCFCGCQVTNPPGASTCIGDLNCDGQINNNDLFSYIQATDFSCLDVNNDGVANSDDINFVLAFGSCTAADVCGTSDASCLETHVQPGCNNPSCCFTVCAIDPSCCRVNWDQNCVNLATANCGECVSSPYDSCYVAHSNPGCSEPACCGLVCDQFPACCQISWDEDCVLLARSICSSCADPGTLSCFTPSTTPNCDDASCCDAICTSGLRPECCAIAWDATCVALAAAVCRSCGDPNAGDCLVPRNTPYCNDEECCIKVCQVDPTCCDQNWDQACVNRAEELCLTCGAPCAGSCCIVHNTPYCNDLDCCELVCVNNPFCCDTRWDDECVALASLICTNIECPCGNPQAEDCFVNHDTPGCDQELCCSDVCQLDPFCCEVTWDDFCVQYANGLCSDVPVCGIVGSGACFEPNESPGCNDAACCALVCSLDPSCCSDTWDLDCATLANVECPGCGSWEAGSCYVSGGPYCRDFECCIEVCNVDIFCCTEAWDSFCTELAWDDTMEPPTGLCNAPAEACGTNEADERSCFQANAGPGCGDPSDCCDAICSEYDNFCCEQYWDEICVAQATTLASARIACRVPGNRSGRDSCLSPHADIACSDWSCAAAVCFYDPLCCTASWSQDCVDLAYQVCVNLNQCPGPLLAPKGKASCFEIHPTPGCEDATCCNAVCFIDPSCCESKWDISCKNLARDVCTSNQADWNCPCTGRCLFPNGTPGCEDESCCNAVCNEYDPFCCETEWDIDCAEQARVICTSAGTCTLCGSALSGDCLEPHTTPYCDDVYCCKVVCEIDPTCCTIDWDIGCVSVAEERCARGCGLPQSGNCFNAHANPGCEDLECCSDVCEADPFCCTTVWDSECVSLAYVPPTDTAPADGLCAPAHADLYSCGELTAGQCCKANGSPGCDDTTCCDAVCLSDSFCCDNEWDDFCAQTALVTCVDCGANCGEPCAGLCCQENDTPSCNDADCCLLVCESDPFCCESIWDEACASTANAVCIEECEICQCGDFCAESCCFANGSPNCSDQTCCDLVCTIDPFCCSSTWDGTCALQARELCDVCAPPEACGDPNAGSCFFAQSTPYCNDADCCNAVCDVLPECCDVQWDFSCAGLAFSLEICFPQPTPPVNDECANAIPIGDGATPFDTTDATTSVSPPVTMTSDPCVPGGTTETVTISLDIFYRYTATCNGEVTVSTCQLANSPTVLAVYQTCANASPITANAYCDFCDLFTSRLTFNAVAGTDYLIRLGSAFDLFIQGTLVITCEPTPPLLPAKKQLPDTPEVQKAPKPKLKKPKPPKFK